MYHAKLRIDLLPMTANKMCGMGWRARHKHALEVKRIVHAELLSLRVIPEKPIKKAKLKLTRCSSKRPDLVRAGVLYDDNIDVIGEPEYKWESAGQHCGHIKIEITEI